MIGYVTVGTNDLPRAAKFYDALAAEMDTPRMMEFETFIAWGTPGGPDSTIFNGMNWAARPGSP